MKTEDCSLGLTGTVQMQIWKKQYHQRPIELAQALFNFQIHRITLADPEQPDLLLHSGRTWYIYKEGPILESILKNRMFISKQLLHFHNFYFLFGI